VIRQAAPFVLAAFCLAVPAAAAGDPCPVALAQKLWADGPSCTPLAEGRLDSGAGNGGVAWQLYRWVPGAGPPPSPLYDVQPYNQVAVTLAPADRPDRVFWTGDFWPGEGWFEAPFLAANPDHGELLVVPGRYTGTGAFVEDRLFLPAGGRWKPVAASQFEQDSARGWLDGLTSYLPPGGGIWKGVAVDYATLTGSTAVWLPTDANCCPSGGEIRFRLRIAGEPPALEVAGAEYLPPAQ